MRKRVRANGRVYYFFDTGAKPRKEIPLGTDFIPALQKYAELHVTSSIKEIIFGDVIIRYQEEELPKLAENTIRTQRSGIKHLHAYFKDAPLHQVKPMHIKQFLTKHTQGQANDRKQVQTHIFDHVEPCPRMGLYRLAQPVRRG